MKHFLASLLLLGALPAMAGNLYSGTLTRQDGQFVLTSCNVAKSKYILTDAPDTSQPVLPSLQNARLDLQRPVYLEIFARYEQRNNRDHLFLDSIKTLQQDQGCPP